MMLPNFFYLVQSVGELLASIAAIFKLFWCLQTTHPLTGCCLTQGNDENNKVIVY